MIQLIETAGLACIPFFILLDLVRRKRRFQTPSWWRLRSLVVSALTLALSIAVTIFWATLFEGRSLIDGAVLGGAGALVGILIYELVHYWYHRTAHNNDLLWRWAHQMHHSAESVDAFGAYYLHPVDTFMFTTCSSLVFYPLLGLTPLAGVIASTFLTFNAMFQHANISTPRWLGYILQRPESHCVHHERQVHEYNYSDLPLWDLVFGTFHNPARWEGQAGFYDGASSRIGEMLIGRDVTRPAEDRPVVPAAGVAEA